jgi:enoyl-CoA hydratase/carnithine racemase
MFRLHHDGEAARLTLDRPEARNAVPLDGWDALAVLLEQVARSEARLLVVAGAGGAFCAGADLGDFPALNRDEAARVRFREAMRAALDRLRDLAMPAIAWIEGPCYGAGVALAMACDIRIAGPDARFAITPAKMGISYPQEDVHRLVELVGPGQAARLLFTAGSIDGAEAARMGLVELNAPQDALDAMIAAILDNDSGSLAALKRAVRLAADGRRSDSGQDRSFDALIGGAELARRLEALRRK